jgi:hypothetical protein
MPDEIVGNDQWSKLIFYPDSNSLELRWLPTTREATEEDARSSMEMFASEAVNRRPNSLIVDTTEFFHRFGEGFEDWREASIIPKYNASGVKKFAFVMSPDYPGQTVESGLEPAAEGTMTFPTGGGSGRGNTPTNGSPTET